MIKKMSDFQKNTLSLLKKLFILILTGVVLFAVGFSCGYWYVSQQTSLQNKQTLKEAQKIEAQSCTSKEAKIYVPEELPFCLYPEQRPGVFESLPKYVYEVSGTTHYADHYCKTCRGDDCRVDFVGTVNP
jgi:hypothetical protein